MRWFCVCLFALVAILLVVGAPNPTRRNRRAKKNSIVSSGFQKLAKKKFSGGPSRYPSDTNVNFGGRRRGRGPGRRSRNRRRQIQRRIRLPKGLAPEVFRSEIVLDELFTNDLNDPNSAAFMTLATNIENSLLPVYRKFYGQNTGLEVISFREGSTVVIVEVTVRVPPGFVVDKVALIADIISTLEEMLGIQVDLVVVNINTGGNDEGGVTDSADPTPAAPAAATDAADPPAATDAAVPPAATDAADSPATDAAGPNAMTTLTAAPIDATSCSCGGGAKPVFSGNNGVADLNSQIYEVHNYYRCLHGVDPLNVDATLENAAQQVAQQNAEINMLEHSAFDFGENLYFNSAGLASVTGCDVVQLFYQEIKDYNFVTGDSPTGGVIGHFTQVVWMNAETIGCYAAMSSLGGTYVACEYDEGNILGQFTANVLEILPECANAET